jgi:hypothetical protein
MKAKAHWFIFIGASFIAFFHCLALGQAYFADDLLAYYAHARFLLKTQLAMGHFPLWNPYYFGGEPFFADPNVMMAYPLNYPTLLFPIPYGLGVFYFIHVALAGFGMHGWLKSLRLSETPCRLLALAYCLSGLFWCELIHPPILAALAWFPFLMWAFEKLSRDLSPRRAFLTGLVAALIFVCGNFQMTSWFYYTGFFYFLGRLFLPRAQAPEEKPKGMGWKKWAGVLLFGFWGAFPMFLQLVPIYEFSHLSNRTEESLGYDDFNSQFSLQPHCVYQFFFPSLGLPPDSTIERGLAPVTVDVAFLGVFGYLGIWVPFLIPLAFRRKDKSLLYLLASLAVFSLLTAFGKHFFLHRVLCAILPTIKLSRAPFRFVAAYVACSAILAGFGYQALERTLEEKGKAGWLLLSGLAYGGVFFLFSFINPAQSWREMIALVAGSGGLALWGFSQTWKPLGRWVFQGALILPLFLSGWSDYAWGPASNFNVEEHFPAFTYLKANNKACRYFFDMGLGYPVEMNGRDYRWSFPVNSPLDFGIRMSNGYNPLVLKGSSEIQKLPLAAYLHLMAIRGLLFGQDHGESKDFTRQVFGNAYLYELAEPPSYANAPSQVTVVPGSDEQIAAMQNPVFNPASQAILSEALPASITSQLGGQPAQLKFDLVRDDPDHEAFQVQLDKNSLVTFSEVVFPGWKAFLDGQPAPLFTADHVFRAVYVPAGSHQVEFSYQPFWAKPFLAAGLLWLLSTLGLGGFLLRQKGKAQVEASQG